MSINKYHLQVLVVEAAIVILTASIILLTAWARTRSQPHRAEAFLSDLLKLQVGRSTFEEAKIVALRYGGVPWYLPDGSMRCTYEKCTFHFVFENKPLSLTYVVPYTALLGTITIKNGVMTERNIHYSRYSRLPFAYNIREIVPSEDNTPEAQGIKGLMGLRRMNVNKEGIPSAVSIGLEPSTNPDERTRAYALNVSCLSKVLGCSGPSAVFPSGIPYRGVPYQTHSESW